MGKLFRFWWWKWVKRGCPHVCGWCRFRRVCHSDKYFDMLPDFMRR